MAENDYPPVDRDEVYKEIFDQADNFKRHNKNAELITVSHKAICIWIPIIIWSPKMPSMPINTSANHLGLNLLMMVNS